MTEDFTIMDWVKCTFYVLLMTAFGYGVLIYGLHNVVGEYFSRTTGDYICKESTCFKHATPYNYRYAGRTRTITIYYCNEHHARLPPTQRVSRNTDPEWIPATSHLVWGIVLVLIGGGLCLPAIFFVCAGCIYLIFKAIVILSALQQSPAPCATPPAAKSVLSFGGESAHPQAEPVPTQPSELAMTPVRALQVLGLSELCTSQQKKNALLRCLTTYKSDRISSLGANLQTLATQKVQQAHQAHTVLSSIPFDDNASRNHPDVECPISQKSDPFIDSPIYDRQAIVSAPEESGRLFIKGPFGSLERGDREHFNDPYVEDVDYKSDMGRVYLSINSWKGRIRYTGSPEGLFPDTLYEIAELGGWDRDSISYEEVFTGGADVLPDYTCKEIATGIRKYLQNHLGDILHQDTTVPRVMLLKACDILEAGPTTMPW